ncbi:hybrid sensor histidine kinase/response regulator [Polyangium mundeleinium]|uniref:histidine kinase n=1 Tax=Polyangium mundeleinium TaxID=2995306 RepID=A0ABT5F1U5_9BACT|nr:GAF domain-containing protein [Polyangium mundeleinium]MDC0747487.1 GAF domain-containing protein [Polyangium mundeleinium]
MRVPLVPSYGGDFLQDCQEELARRPSRQPDHAAENRALVELAEALTGPPEAILPKLVELALSLCQADSAGVSLLETEGDEEVFRWHALAGADVDLLGTVVPRYESPCGIVVDRNATLLFRNPTRHFTNERVPDLGVVEALTVPFHDGDKPVGTVWVFTRSETRQFDREDARILTSLSRFAGSATKAITLSEERKRANEALRASEARHRFFADLAAATQPLADPDEIMATTARLLAEHLGADRCVYAEVEDERTFVITGDHTRGVPSMVGRWPLADFGAAFERAMRANQPYVMDDVDQDPRAGSDLSVYRAARIQAGIGVPLHKTGKLIALMAVDQATPRHWTPEEVELVRLVVGQCWEALERARTARSLRQREERLGFAVELSGIGFWHCDLPFDELSWDERVKEHFWLAPDAPVTIGTFYERIHPDDRARTRQAIETSIHNGTPFDIDYRTVDPRTGALKWIRALGGTAYGPDGVAKRFDGVTVDATVRKLHEERLGRLLEREREQARLLEQVADAALTIHASASLDSVLRVITEEARRIIGAHQSVTTLINANDGSLLVSATSLSSKYEAFRTYDVVPTGKGIYGLVSQTNRPMRLTQDELVSHPAWRNFSGEAGRHPPMRGWLAAPFIGRNGKNLGFIQLSDKYDGEFTEQDEAILIQLAHIASVAIQNARLYDELRDQDRRKDEFLATLAHELRNPLAPIRTGLSLLQMARDEAQGQRIRAMMERQVGHMVRMVDDLLDVSRITRGKVELRKERVELGTVLESALETSRPLIEAAGHEFLVSLPTEPLWLSADPTRLAQVLANLLNNAAKYTPAGGRIRLVAEQEDVHMVVRVEDTGVGIPAEMRTKVFDMFTQVGRSIDRAQGGLGIGLTLVRRLVELHGGTVEATSEGPSRGSIFTVRLPLGIAEETPAKGSGGDLPGKGAAGGLKVLVVDDNVDGAESLAELLQLSGHTTEVAHTGPSALVAARAFEPDVVFLDIGLPGMTGYEVAQRLRTEEGFGRLVLVALTGWGTDEDRRQAREAGFDYHLTKPVDLQEVQRIVEAAGAKRKRVA